MKKKRAKRRAAEQAFLSAYDAAQFPHPSLAVDVALVTADQGQLQCVLIERREHPDLGKWSLPGGFVRMDESLDQAAVRVLSSKVGIENVFVEQLYTFGEPDRDPRTRVVTVAYYALVNPGPLQSLRQRDGVTLASLQADPKLAAAKVAKVRNDRGKRLPLAFDHDQILGLVVQRLRGKLDYAAIGFELLPERFTLRQLQAIHETILNRKLNKDSFRRRMLAGGLIKSTGEAEQDVGHRPAELYRFKRTARQKLRSQP